MVVAWAAMLGQIVVASMAVNLVSQKGLQLVEKWGALLVDDLADEMVVLLVYE